MDAATTGGGGQKQDETQEKWAKARRMAAEIVEAEEAEVEAKAKAVVEEFVQEAVAKAKADAKRKAATDADDGGAGEAKRRKTMATVEERPGSSCG